MQLLAAPCVTDMQPPFSLQIICGRRPDAPATAFLLQDNGDVLTRTVRGAECPVYRCSCGERITVITW